MPARLAAQDTLAAARQLYASAEYTGALTMLNGLLATSPTPQDPTRAAAPADADEPESRFERRGMWSSPLGAAARIAMGVVMLGALGYWWWRLRGR